MGAVGAVSYSIAAKEPEIARQAFIQDMVAAFDDDATSETIQALFDPLRSALQEDEGTTWMRLHLLVIGLEGTLLRNEMVRKVRRLDFYDDSQRDILLDSILDIIVGLPDTPVAQDPGNI